MEREQKTQWHLVEETSREAKGDPRINYSPHPDATPEGELAALAAIFALALEAYEREKAAASQDKVGEEVDHGAAAVGAKKAKSQPRRTA